MRKLILRNSQSPGDALTLTAAVRDLHACYPGQFLTDVGTPYPQLWENNPHITRLDPRDKTVEQIHCEYPLIHQSNQQPRHFLEGFVDFLNGRLGLNLRLTAFRGDLHLSDRERSLASPIRDIVASDIPYWLILAGGKYDFTIKWWDTKRYQQVVDRFRGKICFVQVGSRKHYHVTSTRSAWSGLSICCPVGGLSKPTPGMPFWKTPRSRNNKQRMRKMWLEICLSGRRRFSVLRLRSSVFGRLPSASFPALIFRFHPSFRFHRSSFSL